MTVSASGLLPSITFTPLHMGPAIALKAVAQRRFSLMVFGWSQICMDLQPGYAMLTGTGDLHGLSHTLAGALLIGLVAALSGKPLGELGLRILKLPKELPITWGVAFLSAYIGTLSHIAIDSIMHADVTPWWPLTKVSPFYGAISIEALHVVCLATAAVGALAFWLVRYISARNADSLAKV